MGKVKKVPTFQDGDWVYLKSLGLLPVQPFTLTRWNGKKGWIADGKGGGCEVTAAQITKTRPRRG